jgi:hypothetical protein
MRFDVVSFDHFQNAVIIPLLLLLSILCFPIESATKSTADIYMAHTVPKFTLSTVHVLVLINIFSTSYLIFSA